MVEEIMCALKTKPMRLLSITLLFLNSCALEPYQPPKGAPTATLTYEIESSSFFDPNSVSQRGEVERIDIEMLNGIFHGNDTLFMRFKDYGYREINTIEANKEQLFYYYHRTVIGLGHWPIWCGLGIRVMFEPNQEYVLKGKTVEGYRKPNFLAKLLSPHREKIVDAKCQVQFIHKKSGKIIADSGLVNMSQ